MLKVGMVGMGGISGAHINGWSRIPEARVAAVCDIREDKARDAARRTGGKAYLELDAMLDAEELDVLDICLPTFLHADAAVKALGRGLNVLVEKPVSLRLEDVDRVFGAAAASRKCLMVAQVVRFWREYEVLREAYASGRYGRLLSGRMTRLGNTPGWSWNGWMRDPARSGLVPFDLHIHDLDFMVYAFGKPEDMTCLRAGNEDQDYLSVTYRYPGFFICAEAAWYDCRYAFQSGYRFQFERAVLEYKAGELTIYHQDGCVEKLDKASGAVNGHDLTDNDAYYEEIRYFADCALRGEPCARVKPEELKTVLELIARL